MLDQKIQNQNKLQEAQSGGQEVNVNPPPVEQPTGAKTSIDSQVIGAGQNVSPIPSPSQRALQPTATTIDNTVALANLYPQISIDLIQDPSRFYAIPLLGILVKGIILFPLFLGLSLIIIVWLPIVVINSLYVLATGKYWRLAYNFNLGIIRLWTKVNFFLYGLTNKYPGFSDKINDQFSVELNYPEHPNRLFALPFLGGVVRFILLIPFSIYLNVVGNATNFGVFLIAWFFVLIAKKYPESIFELGRDSMRLNLSMMAYMAGLSDKYPSFRISMNHKLKKLLLIGAVIILSTLNYTYPSLLNYFFKDIPPIDDRDLQLKKVDVPKGQNAFYDSVEAGKYVYEPVEGIKDYLEGKKWDETFVQETLTKNEQALALFDEAAKKPKFQNPTYADPAKLLSEVASPSVKLNPLASLKLSRISSLKALLLARQEKELEAFNEAVKSVEIGQKIQESQVSLIDYLVAVAMKKIGLQTMQKIIANTKLPADVLTQDAKYLEKFKNNEEGLKTALKAEYLLFSQTIDATIMGEADAFNLGREEDEKLDPRVFKKIPKASFYFQSNKTKALFADSFRAAIDDAGKPCGLIKEGPVENRLFSSSASPVMQTLKLKVTENALGRILYDAFIAALNLGVQNEKRCQEDFVVSTTQILFALRAYNLETGGYPSTLHELIPKYLLQVPGDPFDGKPIKYSPTKKILYSVGQDKIDSGGSEGEDWTKMPDPTFKIKF